MRDLEGLVDSYLDFVNAFEGDDPWTENHVMDRLKAILESPSFCGFTLEGSDQRPMGYLLGLFTHSNEGLEYEIDEIVPCDGTVVSEVGKHLLEGAMPLLRAKGVEKVHAVSSDLWATGFFSGNGFKEKEKVRVFELKL
jgi:hypothetical protein